MTHLRNIVVASLLLFAAACDTPEKEATAPVAAEEPAPAFKTSQAAAASYLRLVASATALVGRNAVVPAGAKDWSFLPPAPSPQCPRSGANGITVKRTCTPGADFSQVSCVYEKSYACADETTGKVVANAIFTPSEMVMELKPQDYQEGTAQDNLVMNGALDVKTTGDGEVAYSGELTLVETSSVTAPVTYTMASNVTVVATTTSKLRGAVSIAVNGVGTASVTFFDADFGDCDKGPLSGEIVVKLPDGEQAKIAYAGCGNATFTRYVDGITEPASVEEFGPALNQAAFAASVTDVAALVGAAENTKLAMFAGTGRWCHAIAPGALQTVATHWSYFPLGGTLPAVTFAVPATPNPLRECIILTPSAEYGDGASTLDLVVEEDLGGAGNWFAGSLDADGEVLTHFWHRGLLYTEEYDGYDVLVYLFLYETAITDQPLTFNPLNQPRFTQYCDPKELALSAPDVCNSVLAATFSSNHFSTRFDQGGRYLVTDYNQVTIESVFPSSALKFDFVQP